ncbi:MAG: dipeptide ABC transporter ATP-binding protein [Candidatus Endonucleobacter sp. (ex Gigantidas childressi)]|nr:dipeptide ABC transporter ATP-binding protein [Candidatus Endonucleobacter sp. (ex Gigantidas childressi)]
MITSEVIGDTMEQTSTLPPQLQIKNLSVSLLRQPDKKILKNITIDLHAGSIYALVGESGSGKSITSLSIMRLIPDALTITSGAIFLKQQNLFHLTEQDMGSIRGGKVAMIFQDAQTALNPVKMVGMQIHEALRLHTTLHSKELQKRTIELLKEVGIPEPDKRVDWYPHQMSGGQQQRIMIAIALACNPSVLLADEPTTALDVTIQQHILELLKTLVRSHNLAVLLITHDMGVVRQTADRVGVMLKGQIIEEATCRDFFRSPQSSYSKHLINSLPDISTYNKSNSHSVILKVEKLSVHYPIRKGILQRIHGYTRAVNEISFSIKKGETLALVGESGCGKSTVGRAILNIGHISSGDVWFNRLKISNLSHRQMFSFRKKMQVIFQNPFASMNPRMTVDSIIEEGMISLKLGLTAKERKTKVITLLEKVRLEPECRHRYPHEFSGGQRQRIAIARALAIEPELIICDEPTSSLDVSIRADILDLLLSLQKELNVSYLFITHDLSIIPKMAHQVAVMKNGIIVEQGDTKTIMTNPQKTYTQQLLSSIPTFT